MKTLMRLTLPGLVLFLLSSACMTGLSRPSGPATVVSPDSKAEPPIQMPNREGSFKFAVLGDFGTASRWQYELGAQMVKTHKTFPFEIVLMVGDNIYGSDRPQDYVTKFEKPYKALLDAKVKFQAALGNHDDPNQRFYKHFNMDGKRYYSFKAPKQNVRLVALESTYPQPEQIAWVEKELKESSEDWKIMFFHHPLYSSGGRHGSDIQLRETLEPLFLQPQKGIVHFVAGSGGKLVPGDLDPRSPLTARGVDWDYVFLIGEVFEDQLTFNAISRTGQVVDSGIISRRQPEAKKAESND